MVAVNELDPVPAGSVLLHAGLPKTGTTAVQTTFARARATLAKHGVLYPGTERSHRLELYAFGERTMHFHHREVEVVTDEHRVAWHTLREQIRNHVGSQRIVISHESASKFGQEQKVRFVAELGRPVHVVMTVRNPGDALPSSYQQRVKAGRTATFLEWLTDLLPETPAAGDAPAAALDYARDAIGWAGVVGSENVTVIALDPNDRGVVPRAFERLLNLPVGMLEPSELSGRDSNRSMTLAEAALVRDANVRMADQQKFGWKFYKRFMLDGPLAELLTQREPGPAEPRLSPPQWAADRARSIAVDCNERLNAAGIRIVGDAGTLTATARALDRDVDAVAEVPLDVASIVFSTSVLQAGGFPVGLGRNSPTVEPPARDGLAAFSTRELAREVARRVRRAAGTRVFRK
jgi:hypothetical protein